MPEITEVPTIAKVSEINQKAEEIKQRRALPPKPGNLVKFSELQEWLTLLPEDAKDRVTIWVYRRAPVINRQLVDPTADNNIDTIYSGFDKLTEEYMKSNHGGGNYKFVIKDEDKPLDAKGGYFQAVLNVDMLEFPPKLDLREVEWDHQHNKGYKSWCRAKKLINDNNMPVIEKVGDTPPVTNGVDANMLKMMLDFTAKMSDKEQEALKRKVGGEDAISKSMNELFLEKLKQEDPSKQMNMVVSLVTAMQSMQPKPQPDNTLATIIPMFMTMMQQANESANRQMTFMVEMMKANQPKEREETDELDKLQKLLAIAKEIKGGGSAPEKTVTESIIEAAGAILPGVLDLAGRVMAANAVAKGMTTGQPQQQVRPDNSQVITEQNKQLQQPQVQQGAQVIGDDKSKAIQMIQAFTPQIITHLAGDGYEFGLWIAQGYGDMIAASIANLGPDKLMEAAKGVPEFWNQVASTYGEPHFRKWLESLCNYKQIVEELDKEEANENSVQ